MDKHRSQTLIDYELLTAPTGTGGDLKRVAAFGWYAGGQYSIKRLTGNTHQADGYSCRSWRSVVYDWASTSPARCGFTTSGEYYIEMQAVHGAKADIQQLPRPYTFPSLDEYKAALRKCGDAFREGLMAGSSEGPVVFGITG